VTEQDQHWMRLALELAERGRGHVEPNPLVGAVLVRDGVQVGAGWHQRYGGPHAEVHALAEAGAAARGASLYVTLEPCCHHGKTPPCTDAVLAAGVARVVAALPDPFPQVAGRGAEQLRAAGVPVEFGPGAAEARRQNAPYLKLLATGRPYVHAKWAMTLDGKLATLTGDSKWISNESSRRRVHALRGRMDAILVGSGTVRADDPLLTARPPGPRTPLRIVLDHNAALPRDSQLVRTAREVPVLVVAGQTAAAEQVQELRALGMEVLALAAGDRPGQVLALLDELGRRRLTNVLVEGGSGVLGSFRDAGAVDEVHVFVAPRLAGGAGALTPVGGQGAVRMDEALRLTGWVSEEIDGDLYVRGWR
jgi:diaminohydroxyphosphoribosylaminopyrimidine deaminase/5-amino-6-(5-phosphoribosylamino)uracil reductase